ncbi:uncharacterized protein [Nicotiana tomentosiformis]|uniref:uncharacterized protein n=1 Tax=Nicotiana tomentosiformis TaxID=4098 RepID=UPI00388C72C7
MAPFEALYSRRCRSPIGWFEVGEAELIGSDLVHRAMEKVKIIKERLKTAQSSQKFYSDVRRRDLEFKEDDWVFLKVVGDPSAIVPVETIEISEELSYEEILVAILDRQVRKLRNKEIASVKVLWRNQQVEEATWEAENEIKKKYPRRLDIAQPGALAYDMYVNNVPFLHIYSMHFLALLLAPLHAFASSFSTAGGEKGSLVHYYYHD